MAIFGNFLDRVRARLGRYAPLKLALVATFTGVVIGVGAIAGVAAGLDHTHTEAFCIGCHELRVPYDEYKGTIHDTNRSGVRATCPDCHEPHDFGPKLLREVDASRELVSSLRGKIDTPEKFEALRHEMAAIVWQRMKNNDSRECRHCHNAAAMSKEAQSAKAWSRHQKAKTDGKTCIDCHFGIAHKEPDGPGPQELTVK